MRNEIFDAHQSIKNNATIETIISKLGEVETYLLSLSQGLSRNGFKENFVLQTIFSTPKNERDIDNYAKANLYAAASSLGRVINILKIQDLNDFNKRFISDFLCDLKPFIQRYDDKQNFNWLLFNTNSHITHFYFDLAKNIFFTGNPGNHLEEHLVLNTVTPFFIRQCIEYKIKGILGIESILIDNINDIRIMDKCFIVMEGNSMYYKSIRFRPDIIKSIYKWTHEFIHGGYRAFAWKTETALDYLKLLLFEIKTSTSFSMNGSVEVEKSNIDQLKKTTEEGFRKLISGSLTINWLPAPEITLI